MMNKYVVCMDSYRVRDAQMFDTSGLNDDELLQIDPFSKEQESHWNDMDPTPFIAVVEAETDEEACLSAGKSNGYDPRCLFAIQI